MKPSSSSLLSLPTPLLMLLSTALAQQMFSTVAAHGGADLDHSGLVRAIEGLAGLEIGTSG